MREQKGADSFGFWVTHGGRESLARISSCCLAFIFRLLCPISNCFGGYDFISFIVLVILFILFSVAVAVSPLGFSLCKFDILVTANCCTIILASLCHGNPLCASAEKTSLIRPSTIDQIESNHIYMLHKTSGFGSRPLSPHCHCPAPILSPFRLFMIFTLQRVLPTGLWPSFSSHRPRLGSAR